MNRFHPDLDFHNKNAQPYKPSICPTCHGQGRYQAWGNWPCDKCAGTGREPQMGGGIDIFALCPFCRGTGKNQGSIQWRHCTTCNGKGTI